MYLLILRELASMAIDEDDLHPTMYLLILRREVGGKSVDDNLHPTMYLLIRRTALKNRLPIVIYIPLCIY